MKSRAQIDPELHILKSFVRRLEGGSRQHAEAARFNLFAAFEGRDPDAARSWSRAMRAAIIESPTDTAEAKEMRGLATDALAAIEAAID